MHYLDDNPGRTTVVYGKEYLFFSGYSYLGMEKLEAFRENIREGMEKYGILFPSSRISNTRLSLYDDFEKELSLLNGSEDTVSYSSGFLAGKAISGLLSERENVFIAPAAHPAINLSHVFSAASFEDWANDLVSKINSGNIISCTIIADAVNIIKSRVYDFSFLTKIKKEVFITCLIDNSHATGVFGENGNGIISYLPQQKNIEYSFSYSLSKAFHLEGGAVSCSHEIAGQLRSRADYSGSTAMSPAYVYAFMQNEELYEAQRKKLQRNILFFQSLIKDLDFISNDPSLPIFVVDKPGIEESLFEKGILISSFAYPDPSGQAVNRVILNALHEEEDMRKLADALKIEY